jgi:hypothetical protein
MALRASAKRMMATGGSMGQSEVLSAPAGAPVFSASLAEAKARARQFYREVRASRRVASRRVFPARRSALVPRASLG